MGGASQTGEGNEVECRGIEVAKIKSSCCSEREANLPLPFHQQDETRINGGPQKISEDSLGPLPRLICRGWLPDQFVEIDSPKLASGIRFGNVRLMFAPAQGSSRPRCLALFKKLVYPENMVGDIARFQLIKVGFESVDSAGPADQRRGEEVEHRKPAEARSGTFRELGAEDVEAILEATHCGLFLPGQCLI